MNRDPLVLVVWFLLHIGKDWFLELSYLLWYPKTYIWVHKDSIQKVQKITRWFWQGNSYLLDKCHGCSNMTISHFVCLSVDDDHALFQLLEPMDFGFDNERFNHEVYYLIPMVIVFELGLTFYCCAHSNFKSHDWLQNL